MTAQNSEPKELSPTITLEARVDIRAIATLAYYFLEKGTPLRSRSSILRTSVEEYARKIVKEGAKPISSIADAYAFLKNQGFVQGSRLVTRNFFEGLQVEALSDADMEDHASEIASKIDKEE